MELTKEQIDEINYNKKDYEQGLFHEPWGIDVNEHRLVIYQRILTGGKSGGSCWGTEAKPYHVTPDLDSWEVLDTVLEKLAPGITYLQYRKIMKTLVHSNEEEEYQYYGNYDDYIVRWIPVDDLIQFLTENEIN